MVRIPMVWSNIMKRVLVKELDPGSSEEDLSVEVVFEPKKDKQKK